MSAEQDLLNDVYADIENRDIGQALERIESYLEDNPNAFEDEDYHAFNNPLELEMFKHFFSDDIKLIAPEIPIKDIYYTYGFLLLEANRLEDAKQSLLKALKFNPVSSAIIFELMEVYKRINDYDSYNRCLKDVFRFAYSPQDLARAYRYLGFFNIEIRNFELAAASYIYSLKYENSEAAYQELAFLKDSGQDIEIPFEDAVRILQDNNVSLVGDEFVVSKFRQWGDEFAEEEHFEEALNMYGCAYSLDDSLENQMRYKMAESILNGDGQVEINL